MNHEPNCRWQQTTEADCAYKATHHYCPHPEHACTCAPASNPPDAPAERDDLHDNKCYCPECSDEQSKADAQAEASGRGEVPAELKPHTEAIADMSELEARCREAEASGYRSTMYPCSWGQLERLLAYTRQLENTRAHDSQVAELKQALGAAQMAIRAIPQDALGRDPQEGHYYRDELLAKIDAALTAAKQEEGIDG